MEKFEIKHILHEFLKNHSDKVVQRLIPNNLEDVRNDSDSEEENLMKFNCRKIISTDNIFFYCYRLNSSFGLFGNWTNLIFIFLFLFLGILS